MQWSQIKTLFILCFLVLDLFLLQQFLFEREEEPSYIPESSREDDLHLNIEGLDNLSDDSIQAPLIYAFSKKYSEEDKATLEKFTNQDKAIINDTLIISKFIKPVPINIDSPDSYTETLQANILSGGSYKYWGKDEDTNILIFFQGMEYPIYFNQSALLLVQLNEDGEMAQYIQTMLIQEEDPKEDKVLIKEIDAVSTLFHNAKEISSGDEVTDVELGYHNLTPLPNGVQVLNPTWRVFVNEGKSFFVNAIEGHYYPMDEDYPREEDSFLKKTIKGYLETVKTTSVKDIDIMATNGEDDEELIEDIIENLSFIIDLTIGVEKE